MNLASSRNAVCIKYQLHQITTSNDISLMSLIASLNGRRGVQVENCNIGVCVCDMSVGDMVIIKLIMVIKSWYSLCYDMIWQPVPCDIMIWPVSWDIMISLCRLISWYILCRVVWRYGLSYHYTVCVVSVQNVSLPNRTNSVTRFYIFEFGCPGGVTMMMWRHVVQVWFCLQNMVVTPKRW